MDEIKRDTGAEFVWPETVAVGMDAPVRWLRLGWADFCGAIEASLAYGVAFTAMGWLLLGFTKEPAYELALTTGFLIVGPFLALGIYDISRRLELGEHVTLRPTLTAWKRNAPAVGFYALILALLMAVWLRVSVVVVALFFPNGMPGLGEMIANVVTAPEGMIFLIAYVMAGAGFALLVFATSVVSIPMLLEREKMDALTAMIVSFNALRKNFRPMLLWALIIVALTAAGFLSWFAGLSVAVPVIGHGTWHAYREVVR
jgi:uncharacterized membrane protein